jgi:putative hemolysin
MTQLFPGGVRGGTDRGVGQGVLTDGRGRYTVALARDAAEMREAQRLRHLVFAEEMGARLDSPISGLDVDSLDAYCDHLLVWHGDQVVGTYRLLAPGRSDRLYSDGEFDLSGLAGIRGGMVEAGRTCVHPDHRGGAVVGLMWAGIARYMVAGGYGWLGGSCSIPLDDGGVTAAVLGCASRVVKLVVSNGHASALLMVGGGFGRAAVTEAGGQLDEKQNGENGHGSGSCAGHWLASRAARAITPFW